MGAGGRASGLESCRWEILPPKGRCIYRLRTLTTCVMHQYTTIKSYEKYQLKSIHFLGL